MQSHVRNVTSDFLYQRSIYITRNQAQQIAFYLRKIGVIDKDGLINYDVRVVRRLPPRTRARRLPAHAWLAVVPGAMLGAQ